MRDLPPHVGEVGRMSEPTPCVFCEIVAGREPAKTLAEWPDSIAIEPLNPVTPGHTLVIPRGHVTDFRSDPIITGSAFARAASIASGPTNLITSAGRLATQSVFHLHIHIVPRREDDGLALPWWSGRRTRAGGRRG